MFVVQDPFQRQVEEDVVFRSPCMCASEKRDYTLIRFKGIGCQCSCGKVANSINYAAAQVKS